MSFGNILKKIRQDNNLTQEELARKIGTSRSNIANYENDKNMPSVEILEKISKIFNCSIDYLMGKSNFENNSYELEIYLNNEIKNNLINDLKVLELSKEELEKAITAFFENYIDISTNPTVDIYKMEDSLIYYAYEIITKYFFKLVNKELTFMVDSSIPFKDAMQNYFEKAEINAWTKLHKILEDIYDFDVLSKLTAEEKVENLMTKLNSNYQFYMCPVYGRISAGEPNWAEECIEGRLPIDPNMMNIVDPEECYFLRVNGESMNKVICNGAYALIRKTDWVENGEIAVVLVNGFDATLKKFTKNGDVVVLEPMSNDPSIQTQIYTKETPIKIIGKYIGKFEMKN